MEQVTSGTPYPDDDLLGGGITPVAACRVEMISTMILEGKVSGAGGAGGVCMGWSGTPCT